MKKSYKGFPIYALIIIGVLIAAQLFSSSFSSQRGQRIEAAKLFEYIDSGVIDAVALEDDVAYAHMKASNIPLSAFSNAAYDFSAVISRDTFVETCRQLAARKAGKPLEDITEIDLGFDLIYLPQPATPWLLDMLPYIIMTVGLMAFWLMMMHTAFAVSSVLPPPTATISWTGSAAASRRWARTSTTGMRSI